MVDLAEGWIYIPKAKLQNVKLCNQPVGKTGVVQLGGHDWLAQEGNCADPAVFEGG